jgi:hypothetical protein
MTYLSAEGLVQQFVEAHNSTQLRKLNWPRICKLLMDDTQREKIALAE